ncbi:nuclear transport factor 2 family protein [Mumia zhuanghuii]|uniref:Nuclear transport factor 2 family protein n=1 Tax=Mumia zhuanghuii TaxID=2585211 RepID=A0A5C4MGV1_9ACTN|nr:nuclear transport factor 2 family protein [Mumia zhuanghuii]TNC43283.1 nuclear transport factor 2 family protein [Mumia zhuanghuii]TNC47456.1 nuclear transport factor 2 family protein [Mumia zhuanghuii]
MVVVPNAAERFRAAVEARDLDAFDEVLAPDVTFHSPVKFSPFRGREVVKQVLSLVMVVFEDFRYVGELDGSGSRADEGDVVPAEVLVFRATVDGLAVHGIDMLHLGDDGLVEELTVMLRPLSAVQAMRDAMNRAMVEAGMASASVLS